MVSTDEFHELFFAVVDGIYSTTKRLLGTLLRETEESPGEVLWSLLFTQAEKWLQTYSSLLWGVPLAYQTPSDEPEIEWIALTMEMAGMEDAVYDFLSEWENNVTGEEAEGYASRLHAAILQGLSRAHSTEGL